jgi:YbbR domain-containing protein
MKRIWPFRHLGLKIWSVALAAMLWFVVAGEETVERGLRVPLELQQFPAGLELQVDAPSLIDVRVRGASGALSRLGPGDVVAVLDLRTAKPGRRLYQMTFDQVRTPFGIEVVQITPPSIVLEFEASATKSVRVAPDVEGTPAPGFVVGPVTSDPPTVEIVGPESAVQRAVEAMTEPISVDGATEDVHEEVTVGMLDQALRLATPQTASVTVHVMPGPTERTLSGVPVRVRGLAADLHVQVAPNVVDVVLRGTRENLARVDHESVEAYVDGAGLGVGEYGLGVKIDGVHDAGVARILPPTVQLKVTSVR